MKISVDKVILCIFAFVMVSCSSNVVITNRYVLNEFKTIDKNSADFSSKTILIASVDENPILRTGNIPYKNSSVELNFFVADKWASRVDELFRRNLQLCLNKSNNFKNVYDKPQLQPSDYYLSIYIDYIGEEKIGNKRYASVKYDVTILNSQGETLYKEYVYEKSVMKEDIHDEKYVTKLVKSLSQNISTSLANTFSKFYTSE